MKIILDAMGGDNAPASVAEGAVRACEELGVDVVLVGREAEINQCLANLGINSNEHIQVVNATEVVTMEDDPSMATRRKKDSSMTVALTMLKNGEGDAVVSAGSTGALLTGATLIVKRIRGIRRAAMGPVLPNGGKGVLLMDCGANVDCTPEYLLQFAYMGSFYAERIMGCKNPRVALLNVGTEDTKGGALQKESFALLREAADAGRINFIGNAEGSDLMTGRVDVMVTDGFSGNIMLKTVEGAAKFMFSQLKDVLYASTKNKLAALAIKKDLSGMKAMLDPSEVGGTAMLGISKPVIKAHGSSDGRAIFNAIRQAKACAEADVAGAIAANIEYMKIEKET
ncbi:MAG: phosphate acyltransferase PlsX [Oscillospiraceae bacterium]|nr:phosphate acyltransferase PlsX [Oscillospiraceae bacterium]